MSDTPPAFVEELFHHIASCMEFHDIGNVSYSWLEEDGRFLEIWIYPVPDEIVGGRHDGELVSAGFSLDLLRAPEAFEEVRDVGWNSVGYQDGPYVYLEGSIGGYFVFVQILSIPPDHVEPAGSIDLIGRE